MPLTPTNSRCALLLLLLCFAAELLARDERANEIQITIEDVRAGPPADIEFKFRGLNDSFVPSCGTASDGTRLLCTAATQLEVHTRRGWRPVRLRRTFGILGGIPLSQAQISDVAADRETSFIYRFSRRFFEVDPGQELRVRLQIWHNRKAIASGVEGVIITSPPFKCPEMRIAE